MNQVNSVVKMLEELSKNKIEYAILRDFIPIDNIESSKDVDVYIPKKYAKQVHKIFKKNGWYNQKINCSRFPHKQYIYLTKAGIKKIDIVYGLYYGDKLFKLDDKDILIERQKINKIYVLNQKNALKTMILHILFDKGTLSKKNKKVLQLMYNACLDNGLNVGEELKSIVERMLNEKELELTYIEEAKSKLYKKYNLEYNFIKSFFYKIILKFKNLIRFSIKKMRRKTIVILGVDGSGKSTTTIELKKILNDNVEIQYMGFKDYQSSFAKNHFLIKKNSIGYKIKSLFVQVYDMYYRYFKVRYNNKIIVFDRYPWEAAINNNGGIKIFSIIFYKILFPRPKKIFYLHCNVETSLNRKNDIVDKDVFIKMKKRFDKKYLNKGNIKSYSTDLYSSEQILDDIIGIINKDMIKYLI